MVVNPYVHHEVQIDSTLLNNYVGKYRIPNVPKPVIMELLKRNGKLFTQYEGSTTETELKPESTTKFFNGSGSDIQFEFEVNSNGNVLKAFLIFNSMKKEIERLNE